MLTSPLPTTTAAAAATTFAFANFKRILQKMEEEI